MYLELAYNNCGLHEYMREFLALLLHNSLLWVLQEFSKQAASQDSTKSVEDDKSEVAAMAMSIKVLDTH